MNLNVNELSSLQRALEHFLLCSKAREWLRPADFEYYVALQNKLAQEIRRLDREIDEACRLDRIAERHTP